MWGRSEFLVHVLIAISQVHDSSAICMPSHSLTRWSGERAEALNEIEQAHVSVGGTERGRRYATQQINFSFAALLSGQFQGFCRDLHSECVDHIVAVLPAQMRGFMRLEFVWNRSLDRGNPTPANLGSDFNRLGVGFWREVTALDTRNERRQVMLEQLLRWRNAIAHQNFDLVAAGGTPSLHLAHVRNWRRAVNALAHSFDQVMYNHLAALLGHGPW
jgi:hypothetical protein